MSGASSYPLPPHAAYIWAAGDKLWLALPAAEPGATHAVQIDPEKPGALAALAEVLRARAMAEAKPKIAEPGAPTQAWVKHRERHTVAYDQRCPWCMDELRIKRNREKAEEQQRLETREAKRSTPKPKLTCTSASLESLGL